MLKYFIRRLVQTVPVLLGIIILTFSMIHLTPGDPVTIMLGERGASAEDIQRIRDQLGLNDPLPVQFVNYLWDIGRGDLGESIRSRRPVIDEILERLPSTLELTVAAMLLAVSLGVTLGTLAATAKAPWVDTVVMAAVGSIRSSCASPISCWPSLAFCSLSPSWPSWAPASRMP